MLEVVGVKKHDGDGVAGRACALEFQLQALVEEAEVVDAGQCVGDRPAVGPGDLSGQAPHDLKLLQQQRFQDLRATAHQLAELRGWDPCDAASRRGAHAGRALVTIQTGDLAQH